MLIKVLPTRMRLKELFFYLSFFLFWFSFFVNDIEQTHFAFDTLSKVLRYTSFIVALFGIAVGKSKMQSIKLLLIIFGFGLFTYIATKNTFFIGIGLLSYYASNFKDQDIIKTSFKYIVISTLLVIMLQIAGIFENVKTARWISSGAQLRNSYGFYHSNVLPIISLYAMSYFLLIKRKRIRYGDCFMMLIISTVIYLLCDSRNALVSCFLMVFACLFSKMLPVKKSVARIIHSIAKWIVPACCVFSICVPMILSETPLLQVLDFMFTYRFTYGLQAIEQYGLHLVSIMDTETYLQGATILDNGYMLVALRYGILYLLLLSIAVYRLAKKYKEDFFVNLVIIIISVANIIDNDLFDYACLPFLLISLKATFTDFRVRLEGTKNGKTINFSNNEYIQRKC